MFNTFTLENKIHSGSQLNWWSVLRMHSMKTMPCSRNFYVFFSFPLYLCGRKEPHLEQLKALIFLTIFNCVRTDYTYHKWAFLRTRRGIVLLPRKRWKSNECILEQLVTNNGNLRFVAMYYFSMCSSTQRAEDGAGLFQLTSVLQQPLSVWHHLHWTPRHVVRL